MRQMKSEEVNIPNAACNRRTKQSDLLPKEWRRTDRCQDDPYSYAVRNGIQASNFWPAVLADSLSEQGESIYQRYPKMSNSTNRRHFIELVPFVGLALLAACSPKTEPVPTPEPMPPPQPAPPPLPAPVEATTPKTPPDSPVTTVMPLLDEKDAQAISLGYVADNTRADNVKFKNHVVGSKCSGCSLYLGKVGEADGGCPLFQGKKVSANGWCSAWAKKA